MLTDSFITLTDVQRLARALDALYLPRVRCSLGTFNLAQLGLLTRQAHEMLDVPREQLEAYGPQCIAAAEARVRRLIAADLDVDDCISGAMTSVERNAYHRLARALAALI